MAKVLLIVVILVLTVCFAIDIDKILQKRYGNKIDKDDLIVKQFANLGWKKLNRLHKEWTLDLPKPHYTLWPARVKPAKNGKKYTIMVAYLTNRGNQNETNLYCHISGLMPAKHVQIDCLRGNMTDLLECTEPKNRKPCEGPAKIYAETVLGLVRE